MPGQRNEDRFEEYRGKRIFVLCERQQDFAVAYREQNQLAHWGVAIPEQVAIAWHGCKYLLWHEILHLMNAKDCYNKFGFNKCHEPHCIMRLAPSPNDCGGRLVMCTKNQKRIQRYVTELSAIADFDCR